MGAPTALVGSHMNPPTLSPERLATHLPAEPGSTRQARRFVSDVLGRWSCPHLAEEAALLTSELVTNAVVHARSEVDVRITRIPTGVRIEVMDQEAGSVRPVTAPPHATGGRGLLLVQALAGNWGVRPSRSGKNVWFELSD